MKWLFCGFVLCIPQLGAAEANTVVERWNAEFLAAVRRQAPPPCVVARNLAILHLSVWKAVEKGGAGNEVASVAGSAHEVCTALFSGDRAGFDELLKQYPAATGPALNVARAEADKMLKLREGDGANTTVHYHPDLGPGIWQRTTNNRAPELPHWGQVKPFALKTASQFRPPAPPALNSARYAEDVRDVRENGGAAPGTRAPEQEIIARFWSDFSYTTSPPGRWNEIAAKSLEGRGLAIREKARLFALLNVSMADAGIATWDCKYHYRFWRPVSAIHESFNDGNPATVPDRSWKSLLPAPSHPDYVSGHSTFSGAAALILTRVLGNPAKAMEVTNRDMPGVVRTFGSFEEIAREAGRSRIYGGIHFQSANEEGAKLGRKVAEFVMENFDSTEAR